MNIQGKISHRAQRGPIVMFGTKRPSITSTWIQSQPANSTAFTCKTKKTNKLVKMRTKKRQEVIETMISLFENLSTRADAFTTPWALLLNKTFRLPKCVTLRITVNARKTDSFSNDNVYSPNHIHTHMKDIHF